MKTAYLPVSQDPQQFSDATARAYKNGYAQGYGKKATAPRNQYNREVQPYFEAGFNDGQIDYECEMAE